MIKNIINNKHLRPVRVKITLLILSIIWATVAQASVIFLGPEGPVYNGDTFTIRVEAEKDMPDLIMLDCMLYVNRAMVTVEDYDTVMIWQRPDQSVEIIKVPEGVVEGEVITELTLRAVNTGRDFFGVYWCNYSDSDNNQDIPLNYGIIAPNIIYGPPSYYSNFDQDSDIDGKDLTSFIGTLPNGTSYKGEPEGDFNGDGIVDWKDLVMFAHSFGEENIN